MRWWSALAFALLSCRREAPAKPDPAVVDAAPPTPTARVPLVLRQGRVIDPRTATVVHVLRAEDPRSEAEDGTYAVLLARDGTIHVHELASGKEVWSLPLKTPWGSVVVVAGHALVTGLREVHLLDLRKRSARVLAVPGGVGHPAARTTDFVLVEGAKLLRRVDPTAGTVTPLATLPFDLVGFRSTLRRRESTTVCAVTADLALEVACLDAAGAVVTRSTVDLHRAGDPKGVSFALRAVDERYVLYGTGPLHVGPVRRAAVVRLLDGVTVATAEDEVAAAALREDGSLAGLVVVLPEVRFLDATGALRWKRPPLDPYHESASAVVRDGRLFLDVYPAISSGSLLVALDQKTGATLWKGDVERLPIGHSEYWNEVRLRFDGRFVWLRGDEASMRTFQAFDDTTGNRVLSVSLMGGS
ncbi:MAG: PQQ-binding-like beta-propeller repeat protein [Myxococcales bacterium]|nr:PQQ-binding-like beta-propeller repeat protein [Myxococcales bacterium]